GVGAGHAHRAGRAVRAARAHACAHRARPPAHLRLGRGVAMAIEGPLRELGIHDVFQLLDLSRKTGMLRVTSELRHNAGTISFEDGAIIYAEIRSNPHPPGPLLLRTGKIAEPDLERARDMHAIAQALGRSDFDVAKTLFGLESAGLITLVDPGQQPRPRGAAGDAATLVAQAEDALRRRDFEGARAAAEQAAAIQPHDAAVHLVLGKIHAG